MYFEVYMSKNIFLIIKKCYLVEELMNMKSIVNNYLLFSIYEIV